MPLPNPSHAVALCIGGAVVDSKLLALGPLHMGSSNPARAVRTSGGVARNVADNLARLGLNVKLISCVGQDALGDALLAQASLTGIDTSGTLRRAGVPTDSYTAVLDHNGEMLVAMAAMTAADQLLPDVVDALVRDARPRLRVLDMNLPADTLAAELRAARPGLLAMVAVSVEKMGRMPRALNGLDLLVLNHDELQGLVGQALPRLRHLRPAIASVLRRGVRHVVVTMGRKGVLFASASPGRSGPHEPVPSLGFLRGPRVAALDVTGAGDAFAAAACWSLLQDADQLRLACQRGQYLATLTLLTHDSVCADLTPETLLRVPL